MDERCSKGKESGDESPYSKSSRRFAQPVADDVEHQWVQAEGRAEVEADARPFLGKLSAEAAEVFGDVRPGREEVRQQQDSRRAEFDATGRALRDRWLGEFEVRGLDDVIGEARTQLLGELQQVGVGCGQAAAVSDQQDGSARFERGCGGHDVSSAEANEPPGQARWGEEANLGTGP